MKRLAGSFVKFSKKHNLKAIDCERLNFMSLTEDEQYYLDRVDEFVNYKPEAMLDEEESKDSPTNESKLVKETTLDSSELEKQSEKVEPIYIAKDKPFNFSAALLNKMHFESFKKKKKVKKKIKRRKKL